MPTQARKGRSNPPISFRPSDATRQQLDELMAAWGENQSQAVTRCIALAHVRQQGGDLSAGTRAIVQRDMEGENPSIELLHAERERINGLLLEAYRAKPEQAKEAQ